MKQLSAVIALLISVSVVGAYAQDQSIGRPDVCPKVSVRPWETVVGPTVLAFRITVEGTLKDIIVEKSSGVERLDAMAALCATSWHYKPAVDKGVPVEIAWHAEIHWKQPEE